MLYPKSNAVYKTEHRASDLTKTVSSSLRFFWKTSVGVLPVRIVVLDRGVSDLPFWPLRRAALPRAHLWSRREGASASKRHARMNPTIFTVVSDLRWILAQEGTVCGKQEKYATILSVRVRTCAAARCSGLPSS